MSADSSDADSAPSPLSNDTLPFEMGGDARVTGDGESGTSTQPEKLPTIGHIGRYVLKFKVGQGGLGTVFAAHDPLLSRLIAIKTVTPRMGNEERESFNTHFLHEARASAGLSHPNIVTVFDAGVSAQGAYIAMELLKGRDLRQMRADGSRPTPAQSALIVRRVADALAYAHAQGVVHCDVKPANIFMVSPTQPKVLDFGIARVMHPTTGEAGRNIGGGSPRYMAPEQVQGNDADRRSDVFSLGVVLYELLTDTNPFARPTLEAITQAVANHTPPLASLVDPAVPLSLAAIVAKAMEKQPSARYQSARVFSRDLRRWLDGQLEGSQGRDTGTDPVGLTQPGRLDAVTPQGALGTITGPRGGALNGGADGVGARAERMSKANKGIGVKDASSAVSGPAAASAGPSSPAVSVPNRGWTITGLAVVALITTIGAVWLGDAGIGTHSSNEQVVPQSSSVTAGSAPGAGPAATAAGSGTPASAATTMAQPANHPVAPDPAATSATGPTGAASPAGPATGDMSAAGDPLTASAALPTSTSSPATIPDYGSATDPIVADGPAMAPTDQATDPDSTLPTVRLEPRIRSTSAASDKPPARRRVAARDNPRDGLQDSVPINARDDDTPGFSRRDERMAPVATAVPTRLGFVEVHVTPAAEIEIDGNPGGSAAPYARLRMTEGTHVITLHREGFQPRRMKVVVSESRPVTVAHNFR